MRAAEVSQSPLATLIRERRLAAGLTQQQVAARAGISSAAVRDLEQGRVSRPRPATLQRLATALDVPLRELAEPVHGVHISVLGPLRVSVDGQLTDPGSLKRREVLGLLALSPNVRVSRDRIIDVLWGATPPGGVRGMLHAYMSRLRRRLAPDRSGLPLIVADTGGYRLTIDEDHLDLLRFRRTLAGARQAVADGDKLQTFHSYWAASEMWCGSPLSDLPSLHADPAVTALGREWQAMVIELACASAAVGRHDGVVPLAQQLIDADPLNEAAHVRMMVALLGTGQQATALNVFESIRRRLAAELGIDPGPQLQELHQSILQAGQARPPAPAAAITMAGNPAQLPVDPHGFTGRRLELAKLRAALAGARDQPTTMLIMMVSGAAGVGKTSLAIHWAHQVTAAFPDGQLYVNLRGFDPGATAMSPGEVVRGFLDALEVPAARIPVGLQDQVALYRSLMAGRRMLILLDNAVDAQQIRPLLPGASGCLVLVTSRNELSGLIVREGAHPLQLEIFSARDALSYLSRRLGRRRVEAEPAAAGEIIDACAALPLALAVVAARAAVRPRFALADLACELRRATGSLGAFGCDDPATDIRAIFSTSYRALDAAAARMYRLLSLHPGPDVSAEAMASAAAMTAAAARACLDELARAHLVYERAPGRFSIHDLLRAYAAELAAIHDSPAVRRAATARLLGHYLQSAARACTLVAPRRYPAPTIESAPGLVVAGPLTDVPQARAWFDAEHAVLLAVLEQAHRDELDAEMWSLAWSVGVFLDRQGHWHEWAETQRMATVSATRHGAAAGLAASRRGLGRALTELGHSPAAQAELLSALVLYRELADLTGQGHIHLDLAKVAEQQRRYGEALSYAQRSLHYFGQAGHRAGLANGLNIVGWYHAKLGSYPEAVASCTRALGILREIGDRRGEAATLDSLGYAHQRLGEHQLAIAALHRACELFTEVGDEHGAADALAHLGDSLLASGDPKRACQVWQRSLAALEQLGHSDAENVRTRLTSQPGVWSGLIKAVK